MRIAPMQCSRVSCAAPCFARWTSPNCDLWNPCEQTPLLQTALCMVLLLKHLWVQAQHQPAPSEPQPSRQQSAAAVPDWQMGFVPEQDTSEDEDGSQQSDDDSNGDF